MNEILLLKTFTLVGGMLLLTTIGARLNKDFETKAEGIITLSGIILFIILVHVHGNEFPVNFFCLGCVSVFVGWGIGPAITGLGKKFKFRKYLEKKGVQTKRVEVKSRFSWLQERPLKKTQYYFKDSPEVVYEENSPKVLEFRQKFKEEVLSKDHDPYSMKWQNLVILAMSLTVLSVFLTAAIVWFSSIDFGFLGVISSVGIGILAIIRLKKSLTQKDDIYSLPLTVIGILHFLLLLIYDFNRLEEAMGRGDESWETAIQISLSLYLDIINLFLLILELLAYEA